MQKPIATVLLRLTLPYFHLKQKPLAWDLLVIAALVAKCCAQLSGSTTLPLLAVVWQGGTAPQQASGGGRGGRAGSRGRRGGRGRGRGALTAGTTPAQPMAAELQCLHDELQQEVRRQMQGLRRSIHVSVGELNTQMEPPEVRAVGARRANGKTRATEQLPAVCIASASGYTVNRSCTS